MKIWKIIRGVLYAIITALLLIFAHYFVENVKVLVGGLMLVYGLPEVIIFLVKNRSFKDHTQFFWATIEIILGIVTLTLVKEYSTVCVTWAIWSILREAYEIEESVHELKHHKPGILSIIESLVVIYFSITLLLEPGEHHAHIHVIYILPIELITTGIIWPLLELLFKKVVHKNIIHKEHHEE